MELWSLMHFLMPQIFSSQQDFKEWFSNPFNQSINQNQSLNIVRCFDSKSDSLWSKSFKVYCGLSCCAA